MNAPLNPYASAENGKEGDPSSAALGPIGVIGLILGSLGLLRPTFFAVTVVSYFGGFGLLFTPLLIGMVIELIADIGLINASIFILRKTRLTFAMWGFVGAIVGDLFGAAMLRIFAHNLETTMSQGSTNPSDTGFTFPFGVAWLLIKLGFFGWAVSYLNRDAVRRAFGSQGSRHR